MRKEWLGAVIIGLLLSGCATEDTQQQQPAPQQAYNGPVVEIGGADPRYEPYNQGTMQDYTVNGKTYKIIKDPSNFSQVGQAAWYGQENGGNTTAIGEEFDPSAMTAAHPDQADHAPLCRQRRHRGKIGRPTGDQRMGHAGVPR